MALSMGLLWVATAAVLCVPAAWTVAGESVPLINGDFRRGADAAGIPEGWSKYGGSANASSRWLSDKQGLLIDDQDPAAETGVQLTFVAEPGVAYKVAVQVRAVPDRSTAGAYLQFRFLPSNQYSQVDLTAENLETTEEVTVQGLAPQERRRPRSYLYTHREPTPSFVESVRVVSGIAPPPAPLAPPPPLIVPVYDTLKDLHENIAIVRQGKAAISIVVNGSASNTATATKIQEAVKQKTGVLLPVIQDYDPRLPSRCTAISLSLVTARRIEPPTHSTITTTASWT